MIITAEETVSDTVEKPPVTDDINWIQHRGFHNLSDMNPVYTFIPDPAFSQCTKEST